jgi:hypothetical protein
MTKYWWHVTIVTSHQYYQQCAKNLRTTTIQNTSGVDLNWTHRCLGPISRTWSMSTVRRLIRRTPPVCEATTNLSTLPSLHLGPFHTHIHPSHLTLLSTPMILTWRPRLLTRVHIVRCSHSSALQRFFSSPGASSLSAHHRPWARAARCRWWAPLHLEDVVDFYWI